jgi:hypothetical protein
VRLTNPVKLTSINVWVLSTMIECLFHEKKISWERLFKEVVEQQAKLLRLRNLHSCLLGYVVHLYSKENFWHRRRKRATRIQYGWPHKEEIWNGRKNRKKIWERESQGRNQKKIVSPDRERTPSPPPRRDTGPVRRAKEGVSRGRSYPAQSPGISKVLQESGNDRGDCGAP